MTDADECNIKVVCRVRPMNENEVASGSGVCVKFVNDEQVQLGVSIKLTLFLHKIKKTDVIVWVYRFTKEV